MRVMWLYEWNYRCGHFTTAGLLVSACSCWGFGLQAWAAGEVGRIRSWFSD